MKAMILAAGTGTRLLPLTRLRPKPLFPVFNTPLLHLTLTHLKAQGVKEIVINTHHLNEHIISYLKKHTPQGVTITLSHEPTLLGTAGAIKKVEDYWDEQPFILTNGDIVHTIDLQAAYSSHLQKGNLATLIVHNCPRYNQVEIDHSDTIVGFRGKRIRETSSPTRFCAFTGIHIISPRLLSAIPAHHYADIISIYSQLIASQEKIGGYHTQGHYWRDIGSPRDYHHLHRDLHLQQLPSLQKSFRFLPLAPSACIGENTTLDGYVSIGEDSTIGKGCTIRNCIIWDGVKVADHLTLEDCIIGDRIRVSHCLRGAILGES